jgi:hypothetical protein
MPNFKTHDTEKERVIFRIDFQDATRIVDTVIALVRKLETTIYGNADRLYWLSDRDTNGCFPDEVFD